jgi:ABC-type polysaccharide/polyol phosphate export permease|tara:strand:- start:18967 stop:19740 length:774 start_codon:yes stop_codon:yes gene_type:complete
MYTRFVKLFSKDITLLYEVTKSNFKLQNENSILGVVWYLLGPLLLFGIMLFVFSHRLGASIEQYPLYLMMGIIAWNFFATGTGRGMTVITGNAGLIKSLPIRIEILVVAAVLHALITHSIEILIFLGMLFWFGITPTLILLYFLVLFISFLFTFGTGLILATLYVLFRDVQQIWSVLTRAWWFATPIFYTLTETGLGAKVSLFNPLYYSIHLSRELLIYNRIPSMQLFFNFIGFAVTTLCIGYYLFYKLRPRFVALL